jgi:electron transfer flavoprotein alpha/beta subunit
LFAHHGATVAPFARAVTTAGETVRALAATETILNCCCVAVPALVTRATPAVSPVASDTFRTVAPADAAEVKVTGADDCPGTHTWSW